MDLFIFQESQFRILIEVGVAMLLGAILGIEREVRDKPAGLRTHMLVAGAAALLVALGDSVIEYFRVEVGGQAVQTDPIRIIEAVITGVSFLGAGTILRHHSTDRVEGLTTAASLLFAAALGVAVALQQVLLAIGATALTLITLRGVDWLWRWISRKIQEYRNGGEERGGQTGHEDHDE